LLEQQFQLKHYGKFSIFEQAQMISEDRAWYMRRLEKEFKDRAEKERNQIGSVPKPPSMPSRR
jgi:hypothetical protein